MGSNDLSARYKNRKSPDYALSIREINKQKAVEWLEATQRRNQTQSFGPFYVITPRKGRQDQFDEKVCCVCSELI